MREDDTWGRGGRRRAWPKTSFLLLSLFRLWPLSVSHPCCFPVHSQSRDEWPRLQSKELSCHPSIHSTCSQVMRWAHVIRQVHSLTLFCKTWDFTQARDLPGWGLQRSMLESTYFSFLPQDHWQLHSLPWFHKPPIILAPIIKGLLWPGILLVTYFI